MSSELLTERRETTLLLTLKDVATRNCLSAQACAAGIEAINNAADEPGIQCIVLHGDGAHFCGGSDPHAAGHDDPSPGGFQAAFEGLIDVMRSSPKPVIAAVEGHAVDAGFVLALACDVVIAADDACFSWDAARGGGSPVAAIAQAAGDAAAVADRGARCAAAACHGPLANEVVAPGEAVAQGLRWGRRLAGVPADRIAAAKEWYLAAAQRRVPGL